MSDEMRYDSIAEIWDKEVHSEELLDLDDLTVGRMAEYLRQVRIALTEVPAEDTIQEDLYRQEIENLEFMIRDLLTLRRDKILMAVMEGRDVNAGMLLTEEEFYGRLKRAFQSHTKLVEDILIGSHIAQPETTVVVGGDTSEETVEHILVRFTKTIDTPFVGIDERVYGPFEREDVAVIPALNAQPWLRDGTVIRIVPERSESGTE